MKTISALLLAAAVLVPSAARAQSALQDLAAASGADLKPLTLSLSSLKASADRRLMIPRDRKDVFASCSVIDAKAFRAYTLPEAVKLVQGCLDQSYGGRKYTVEARAGRFAMRACPQAAGQLGCQAIVEVEGIIVKVEGTILMGDAVLADLDYSLAKRGGKLLGQRAIVEDKAVLAK